jgi:hypothetical protein
MNLTDHLRAGIIQTLEGIPPNKVEEITIQAEAVLEACQQITEGNTLRTMTLFKIINDALQNLVKEEIHS